MIGHEGATQAGPMAALKAAGVELLADLHTAVPSRRPGFPQDVLVNGPREARTAYAGPKALGTPIEGPEIAAAIAPASPRPTRAGPDRLRRRGRPRD